MPPARPGHPGPRASRPRELRCDQATKGRDMATETTQATDHTLYVAGEWIETGKWSEVNAPYDGTLIGRVPKGDAALVDRATRAAAEAFAKADFPQHERAAM